MDIRLTDRAAAALDGLLREAPDTASRDYWRDALVSRAVVILARVVDPDDPLELAEPVHSLDQLFNRDIESAYPYRPAPVRDAGGGR
ncbi:MAG: hypothetical protein F4233_15710 [Rhodospirillaceae bacterium]|nr:hypothetical protein [Rhodospirillaceae bacterium]